MTEKLKNQDKKTVHGGCHCGAVQYEATINRDEVLLECNCSMCSMTGFLHLIVPHGEVRIFQGLDQLNSYRFNTGQANHLFCKLCGVKSFYQPRSHPDCWSLNAHCLNDFDPNEWTIESFDGRNWEQAHDNLNPTPKP